MNSQAEKPIVIVGGGIAGVTCAESLHFLLPQQKVVLVTASPVVKAVTNVVPMGKNIMQFDVRERDALSLQTDHPNLSIVEDVVAEVDISKRRVLLKSGTEMEYKQLCLCMGARPKLIAENNDRVVGIRDTESVANFANKLKGAKRIMIVGNGGIATELAHELRALQVVWVIKDAHISATFVDPGAAAYFQDKLYGKSEDKGDDKEPSKRMRYTVSGGKISKSGGGASLGPDWQKSIQLDSGTSLPKTLTVEYECEVAEILENVEQDGEKWPIYARLTNGAVVGCDLIVSATGVVPNSDLKGLESLEKGADGGYLVDWKMETTQAGIFAAGDVCSAGWQRARQWFQMRLWTQAHQMGRYVAKSMASTLNNELFYQDFCFELFTHVTRFFNQKVVLLGLYNGQTLDNCYEILLRVTKGEEYVKLVLVDGKIQGAVLIGETDLEEMCENLILNQLDVSIYGEDLLNPDIDIDDYFD